MITLNENNYQDKDLRARMTRKMVAGAQTYREREGGGGGEGEGGGIFHGWVGWGEGAVDDSIKWC